MNRRPTIKDVAARARVAPGTVSKVMNGDTRVHPVIRSAVEEAIRALDYHPSPIARNLRRGRSGIIGFVVSDIVSPTWAPLLPQMQQLTRKAGYALLIMDSGLDAEIESRNIELLSSMRVDGIVWNPLWPLAPQPPHLVAGLPLVTMPFVQGWEVPNVYVNMDDATLAGLDDLLQRGHKRIAFITMRLVAGNRGTLMDALHERIGKAGGALVSDSSWNFISRQECLQAMPAKLKGEGRPTALLVAAPLLEPVLCVLRDVGLKIPRDISVIALASSELAVAYDPPINAVEFPTTELAAEAVRILLEQIAGSEGPPAPMSYQSEYVVRGSVASPPASRPTNG